MLTLTEHLMIIPDFVGFTLLMLYFLWRSSSILFVCFVLVVFVVSFCVISISPCFWIYGFLKSPFGLLPRCSFANVYEEQYS